MTQCDLCGADVPAVVTIFGGYERSVQPTRCDSCKAEISSRLEIARDSAMAEQRTQLAGLPHSATAWPTFQPWVDFGIAAVQAEPLVWVCGEVKSGRTVLAICVGEWALRAGWSVRYDHGSRMEEKEGWAEMGATWLEVDLLIVDNLLDSRHGMPKFLLDKLDALLQRRSDARRHTLVTSSRSLRWLDKASDESFQARALDLVGETGAISLPARVAHE